MICYRSPNFLSLVFKIWFNTVPKIPQTVLNVSKEFLNNKNLYFLGKSIFVSNSGEKRIWWQLFVWESRWCLRVRERVWDRPKKDYAQTHTMCVSHLTGQSKIKAYFGINSKPLLEMSFKFLLIKDSRFFATSCQNVTHCDRGTKSKLLN